MTRAHGPRSVFCDTDAKECEYPTAITLLREQEVAIVVAGVVNGEVVNGHVGYVNMCVVCSSWILSSTR